MTPETKTNIICGLSVVALVLLLVSVFRSQGESYISYPFGPINPPNVNPMLSQTVYGMGANHFELGRCNNSRDQSTCAWKTLAIADAQQTFGDNMNVQFEMNSIPHVGQDAGAAHLLTWSDKDPTVWGFL